MERGDLSFCCLGVPKGGTLGCRVGGSGFCRGGKEVATFSKVWGSARSLDVHGGNERPRPPSSALIFYLCSHLEALTYPSPNAAKGATIKWPSLACSYSRRNHPFPLPSNLKEILTTSSLSFHFKRHSNNLPKKRERKQQNCDIFVIY